MKRILMACMSIVMAMILALMSPLAVIANEILITDFDETDPLSVFSINASRVTYTAVQSGNQTQKLVKSISDIAENSSFRYTFDYRQTGQAIGTGSSELFVGFGTANYTVGDWNSVGNYSLGMRFYQTGTGVLFQLVETVNGTIYYSANESFGISLDRYFALSRNDTSNLSVLEIYNDSGYTSLNTSFNLTLHSKPAYTYMFFPLVGYTPTTGTTSMTGYIQNLYRSDTPDIIGITTDFAVPYFSPVRVYGSIISLNWSGNVTYYGFQVGTSNGTWNYTQSMPMATTDNYGTFNSTSNGTIMTSLYDLSANTTYYYRAFVAGYDSGNVYRTFYGSVKSFTSDIILIDEIDVMTGNITQTTNPTTLNQSVILTGSASNSAYPVIGYGFLIASSAGGVISFDTAHVKISHTGLLEIPIWQDFYDYPTSWTTVYVRAYAIDNNGNIAYGDIVSLNPVAISVSINITPSAIIAGHLVTFQASLNQVVTNAQYVGFGWGTTNSTAEFSEWYTAGNYSVYAFTSPVFTLNQSTVYYYRAFIMAGNDWIYSSVYSLTTGIELYPDTYSPIVTITNASNISYTRFITQITATGGNLTSIGIEIKLPTDTDWQILTYTSNVTVGSYNITISGLSANTSYYYRGFAKNIYGTGYSDAKVATTLNPAGGAPAGGNVIPTNLLDLLRQQVNKWGMNNTFGYWALMVICQLLSALIFGAFILGTKDEAIRKILALVMGIVAIGILGGFAFSGLLGAWAVGILVIIAVGLILILGGKLLNKGEV